MSTPRVLVVGDIVTDVLAVHSGDLVVGSDTVAQISLAGGGSAANAAVWLAYAGCAVEFVGVAGTDIAGDDRIGELTAAGVGCTAVRRTPDAATGSVIVLTHAAERTMLTDRGASRLLDASDVDNAFTVLPGLTHLHLSGYTLLDTVSRPAALHALAEARRRGLTMSVDAASAGPLSQVGPAEFLSWVEGADILFANLDEAFVLTSLRSAREAARQLTTTVRSAVVKRGEFGALRADADGTVSSRPAVPVDPVVDPTGAGDAFAGGYLAAWLAGADEAEALDAGARLGAEAVSRLGGRP
jgi:sugar/nucleoside kinase (ribokinase family)